MKPTDLDEYTLPKEEKMVPVWKAAIFSTAIALIGVASAWALNVTAPQPVQSIPQAAHDVALYDAKGRLVVYQDRNIVGWGAGLSEEAMQAYRRAFLHAGGCITSPLRKSTNLGSDS